MIDDYHNVHAKTFQPILLLLMQFTWQHLVDIFQLIPAVLQPPNVSIHRPVRVNVKGTELTCYSGIDEQVIRKKMQQALVNMGKTFMTQLALAMLKVDPKNL